MGVRARRWQLWLITTFILTGMIGMVQLFKGPESVGAVQVVGGAGNPTVAMPSRSVQATELPSWTPTAQPTQNPSPSTDVADIARAPRTTSAAAGTAPVPAVSPSTKATQFPTTSTTAGTTTKVGAKSVTPTATVTPTTAKPATSTATKSTTSTKPVTTTTQAKPTPSPVRTTTATSTTRQRQPQPTRCYRVLWFTFCR